MAYHDLVMCKNENCRLNKYCDRYQQHIKKSREITDMFLDYFPPLYDDAEACPYFLATEEHYIREKIKLLK